MSITHIVMFQFASTASKDSINDACKRMLSLKDKCIHPSTGKPYIQAASGGKDNSPEGQQGGISHIFVVEFANASDRDYYVADDPVHKDFVKTLGGVVERAQVVDFTDGEL
ncbi:hypothetical protein NW762_014694 [Fusarium torreyae]|uniref:Stress-response A/B barrel domain-containing protein n=1 Tax=Fusarium torreyae TaxID=1237075 RepID=A0A9W8V7I8_9HYPO|nr:hypothetical protein NW762_014694 [Fusarium torreyae]